MRNTGLYTFSGNSGGFTCCGPELLTPYLQNGIIHVPYLQNYAGQNCNVTLFAYTPESFTSVNDCYKFLGLAEEHVSSMQSIGGVNRQTIELNNYSTRYLVFARIDRIDGVKIGNALGILTDDEVRDPENGC